METSAHLELVPCNLCGRDEFTVLFNSPFKVPDDQAAGDFVTVAGKGLRVVRVDLPEPAHGPVRLLAETLRGAALG